MLNKKPNLPGKQCGHRNCREVCHVKSYAKPRTPLKRTAIKRKPFIAGNKNEELEAFFEMAAAMISKHPKCAECGAYIPNDYYRHATAHLLPKRKNKFPSVACHPENFITLGSHCGCHQKYDRSWDDASKMKVWSIVIEKIKKIYPYIAENELYRLPTIVLDELKKVP